MALSNKTEHEERCMSDLSDWASNVTSASEIQLNNLAIEQDIYNLKRECEEKDAIIKELNTSVQSSNVATLKASKSSSSTSSPNYWQIPPMLDNLLYDMDSTTSPSSSDLDSSQKNGPQTPLSKAEEVSFENGNSSLKGQQKSAPAKVSSSFMRQTDCHSMPEPVTPVREISMNHKSKPPSSRQRQVSTSRDSKRIKKQTRTVSKDFTSKKRWS
ncbi:Detected protein of unknown function [Hibiscus syriacus]|uniref:Uncharacterized protein n=1 Tax=Hibiscus syriacus TaxID=106335 RepID=A0A6A3CG20_HIBSY|nr:Detected protein of unknown function [Hibiscus syriacus]